MSTEFLYGWHPVIEALRAGRRQLRRLYLAERLENSPMRQQVVGSAEAHGLRVEERPRSWLAGRAKDANTQGVLLEVGDYPYHDWADLIDLAVSRQEPPFMLVLDLLQDVQNVGTLLRTAEAVGVHGVIIQERRAASITPAVVSASSGASEHLLVAQVTNIARTIADMKEADVWFAGLEFSPETVRFDQANLSGGLGLVVGSEGKGLRRLVRESCDFLVHLPMRGQIESLNAATAGSVMLYAAWQARGFSGTG
ncbi:MAG: 23S rRNA (guanosine(2251)-2'-O)-methyltransferase RlmB [Chloroflexi bacterium]|nr:23S rRNA (guanosine(2251)-2'-O)-methyltransferase RlmB [Chloroflexota bacterium]